jgi:thiol-disulfide isomerase/thioredoxin
MRVGRVAALLVGLGLAAVAAGAAGPTLEDPRTGQAVVLAPDAQVTHLVFFATWCPPCLEELRKLAELEARWGDEGYRLVIVAVQVRHTRERLAGFIAERQPPGRVLFDAKGEAERFWKASQVPTHLLLDARGATVVRRGALDSEIEKGIASLLAPPSAEGER